jgi:hypothetical protein
MKKIISLGLLALVLAPTSSVYAQGQWPRFPRPYRVGPTQSIPSLDGVWYLTGNPSAVCQVEQRWPSTQALFINEHGSPAMGTIFGNQVWIPTWGPNGQGLMGRIQGDRIVWSDGNFWSRSRITPWRRF